MPKNGHPSKILKSPKANDCESHRCFEDQRQHTLGQCGSPYESYFSLGITQQERRGILCMGVLKNSSTQRYKKYKDLGRLNLTNKLRKGNYQI